MRKLSAIEALCVFQKYQKYILTRTHWHEDECAATDSPLVTIDFILEHWNSFPWDTYTLFQRDDWTFDKLSWYQAQVQAQSKAHNWPPVDWNAISRSIGITIDDIVNNPELPWSKDISVIKFGCMKFYDSVH